MKYIFWLFLFAKALPSFSSASNSLVQLNYPTSNKDTSRVLKDTTSYQLKASTAELFNLAKSRHVNQLLTDTLANVYISSDSLIIVSDKGIKKCFKSDSANSESLDQKHFDYGGHYESINSCLIETGYYESGEIILVNKKTGRLDTLLSLPHFSPKDKYFATYFVNGEGGMFINVSIYKTHGNSKPLRIIDLNPETWMPIEGHWLDERDFIIQASFVDIQQKPDLFYLELTIK